MVVANLTGAWQAVDGRRLMAVANVIALSTCVAVGLKARLKAAATKPPYGGWERAR
jgi:hypothetical protein